jgi:hypothetical protein
MNMKMVGTVLVSGMLFVGCGGAETKTAEGPKTDKPAAPAAPTTPTSVSVPGGGTASVGTLPADFPKDVPVYAGATVVSASTAGGVVGAVLNTADAPDKVAAHYKDELAKNGWSAPQVMSAAGTTTIRATKEKRQAAIVVTKDTEGKTNVSIAVTPMP